MNEPNPSTTNSGGLDRQETLAALFAQLVMQHANMAMMLLGKIAHPETGQKVQDLDGAKLFIDELEMLEIKTKGNLSQEESSLLKQSLMSLRLAFVEAVESPAAQTPPASKAEKAATPAAEAGRPAPAGEDHPKKFSKKY